MCGLSRSWWLRKYRSFSLSKLGSLLGIRPLKDQVLIEQHVSLIKKNWLSTVEYRCPSLVLVVIQSLGCGISSNPRQRSGLVTCSIVVGVCSLRCSSDLSCLVISCNYYVPQTLKKIINIDWFSPIGYNTTTPLKAMIQSVSSPFSCVIMLSSFPQSPNFGIKYIPLPILMDSHKEKKLVPTQT